MLAAIKAIHGNASTQVKYLTADYQTYLGKDVAGSESATCWLGNGAAYLGLKGAVRESDFTNLLRGYSPLGEPLVRSFKDRIVTLPDGTQKLYRNTNSYDIPIALEKSFSILAYTLKGEDREFFDRCIKKSTADVVHVLENVLQLGRRGEGGATKVHVKVAAAVFQHQANRQGEPHWHSHVVVSNVGLGADGRWSKLDSKALHNATPMLGRVFRASFAREMLRTFGIALEMPKDTNGKQLSSYAVKGIPRELCEAFSTAREKLLSEAGEAAKGQGKEAARLRTDAHLETRNAKDTSLSFEEIREEVFYRAEDFGCDAGQFNNHFHTQRPAQRDEIEQRYKVAFVDAVEKLSTARAHFTERDVAKEVLDSLQMIGVDGSEICQRVFEDAASHPSLYHQNSVEPDRPLATKKQVKLEHNLLEKVQELGERKGARVRSGLSIELASFRNKLSAEQDKALDVAVRGEGAIRVITGVAGSGKSKLLKAVKELFEARGFDVTGCALAGVVAKDLEAKTGIPTRTVASRIRVHQRTPAEQRVDELKHDAHMVVRSLRGKKIWDTTAKDLTPRSVLIVEEAGMLSTKDMDAIVSIVDRAKATLILVGDTEQLPAIGAGSPLEYISETVKSHAHLETNHRQYDECDKKAVKAMRDGKIAEALETYRERGNVVVSPSPEETHAKLVEAWKENGGTNKPSEHVILTQTRAEAAKLNRLCQATRLEEGLTTEKQAIVLQGERFFPGDRVLFHEALKAKGVENGHFGSVVRTNSRRKEIVIQLERPRTKQERANGLKQVVTLRESDLKKGQLTLGSAATTHKLQGATVENAYVLISGPMTNKEMAYVQLSRARDKTHLFVSRSIAGENLEKLERLLKRSRKNALAHEMSVNVQ